MVKQVGPQRLWTELKAQAPQYAKLLPELPLLLHTFLQRGGADARERALLEQLVREQQSTQAWLKRLLYVGAGFMLGVLAMPLLWRLHIW